VIGGACADAIPMVATKAVAVMMLIVSEFI
jgi:hypothetical protein